MVFDALFRGILGTKDMPAEAVAFYSDAIGKATSTTQWKETLAKLRLTSDYMPEAEFRKAVASWEDELGALLKMIKKD